MFQLLNLFFALFLYSLAWILYKYSHSSERTGFIERISKTVHSSLLQSSIVILTLWIYVVVSIALWIGWTESFVQVMLVGIGLIGGISTILELRNLKKPSTYTDGPEFFISTVEYNFENRSENETKEAILGLICEAETNYDARQALEILLARDDGLGEETKKHYTESIN